MPTTITSAGITFNDNSSQTTSALAAGAIGTTQLADNAATTAKIADSAVTTAKIADSAVTTAKIASNAVTAAKLGTDEQKRIAKAWVNFNGATVASDYTTGNTVTYVAGASTTTVTITRTSHSVSVGDWITVSGVTGATAVNGTWQVTAVTSTTIVYVVPSVVTGTVAGTAIVRVATIRSSYNVSSITKNGTGDYTVNFATAMSDANYSANLTCGQESVIAFTADTATTRTSSLIRIRTVTTAAALTDASYISASIFGN